MRVVWFSQKVLQSQHAAMFFLLNWNSSQFHHVQCPFQSKCGNSHLTLVTCRWFWVFLPALNRHVYWIALCHIRLCVFIGEGCLSSQTPAQQQYYHNYLFLRGETRETESESLCHCGSDITNSIVLGWVTCLLSNFLPAGERPFMSRVSLIFLCIKL